MATSSHHTISLPVSIRNIVIDTLLPHDIKQIMVFGSYATGNSTVDSDLDLIVSFHSKKDLFDLGEMREDLIDNLGIDVDLLTEGAISPYLKNRILNEAVVIYPEG